MIAAAFDRLRVFNIRDDVRHLGRTLMSLAVVAVSGALLVAVLSITGSVSGSVQRMTQSLGGNADLEISGISDAGFDESLRAGIAAVPGVEAAVPMLRGQIGSGTDRVLLVGVDASIAELQSDLQRAVQDQIGAKLLTVPNGVAVGSALGHAEGASFDFGAARVTVAAVLSGETAERLNGGQFVIAPLPLAQRAAGRQGHLDSVLVTVAAGASTDQVRAGISDAVAGRAIVADPSFRAAQSSGVITLLRATTLLSASMSLVVAGFLVYIAMSMAISQRRPVISMLRAIGGRRRVIVRDLLAEAAVVGLIGGSIGAVLGIFAGRAAIDQLPPAIVQSIDTRTEFVLPGYAIPAAVLACLLASTLAAGVAARQVYKVAPIEALSPVGVSRSDVPSRALQVIAALVAVVGGAAAVVIAVRDLGRWSIVSVALMAVASISLCFFLTGPIVRLTVSVARVFGPPGALGASTIERAPRRTWATLMTVAIAVVSIVALTGTNKDVVDAASKSWAGLADTDLYVSVSTPEVIPTSPTLPADLESKIAAVPGVREIVPGQITFASLGDQRVMVYGCLPGTPNEIYKSLDDGVRDQLLAGAGVVLSRDIARSLHVTAGDEVRLPTPSGVRQTRVLAVVPYFSALSGAVVMALDQMRQWFDRPGSTNLAVNLVPGADRQTVADAIRRIAPPDVHVYTAQDAVRGVSSSVQQATALSRGITWIVTGVAAIALLNTLMLSVLERRRELGVLRAIGSSRRFALRMVLAEAAGIGLVGGAIGLAIGTATQYLNAPAMSHVLTVDVTPHPNPMTLIFAAAATLLSLLGSIPPAVRAAHLDIVEALAVD
ncbi:FtsX-like permease family protein [Nocardia suismassiliense]|uniref:FtsX-like permease family protein n=1 Tax=Nocardia suismassiliense TaxID=2077092 RepID=A0ABW6QZI2_9NOCA